MEANVLFVNPAGCIRLLPSSDIGSLESFLGSALVPRRRLRACVMCWFEEGHRFTSEFALQ